jgi:translation elongation factor EF-Tu-like GTPase
MIAPAIIGQRSCTPGLVDVLASVSFLPEYEGGRSTDVRMTYRPLNMFDGPESRESWFGQICLAPTEKISPGERLKVVIQFAASPALLAELTPGRSWRIQEGAQLVAIATVVEVLGQP